MEIFVVSKLLYIKGMIALKHCYISQLDGATSQYKNEAISRLLVKFRYNFTVLQFHLLPKPYAADILNFRFNLQFALGYGNTFTTNIKLDRVLKLSVTLKNFCQYFSYVESMVILSI